MATNDYRSYMRATEEYRHSDTLQHAGKKGMKWGISHTPGYKAIGQKAKGILNSLGNYVYNTYNKLTSKSVAAPAVASAAKVVTKDPAKEARDEAFNERSERLKNPAPPKTPEPKKEVYVKQDPDTEEDKEIIDPKTRSHVEVVGKIDAKEGPKEPQKDDLKEDEHGKYRLVDGEKHYDLGDGKEYLYADGTFFEVGGTGKTVPEGKTPEPAKPGEREPSDRMVDDDGNLKLLDQYGPYFDVNGEKHYDIEGKDYYYSDGLYFPVDGSGEALALVWNDEKFCFEPAEDVRHSETSPRYIGEILDTEDDLAHWGILGMKWGVRRYQNKDGSLTPEGRERYLNSNGTIKSDSRAKLCKNFSKKLTGKTYSEKIQLAKNDAYAVDLINDANQFYDKHISESNPGYRLLSEMKAKEEENGPAYYKALAGIASSLTDENANMGSLSGYARFFAQDDGDQDGLINSRNILANEMSLDRMDLRESAELFQSVGETVIETVKHKVDNDLPKGELSEKFAIEDSIIGNLKYDPWNSWYQIKSAANPLDEKRSNCVSNAKKIMDKFGNILGNDHNVFLLEEGTEELGFSNKQVSEMTDADWTKLRNYIETHSEVQQMDSDQNELYHEGRGHLDGGRSGRYPWGSGADPYQRSELGSARAAAEGILNRAGNMPADKFLNNGILDVSTVANNAIDNGRPLTSKSNQVNAATGAAYSLAANPTWENAAKVVPKAIVDSGTRGWTEHDFDGIPTEIIKQSNERSAAIKAYKGFHGESTPVSDGAAKAAKVASLGLTAIAFIKLVEGLKGKGGSP